MEFNSFKNKSIFNLKSQTSKNTILIILEIIILTVTTISGFKGYKIVKTLDSMSLRDPKFLDNLVNNLNVSAYPNYMRQVFYSVITIIIFTSIMFYCLKPIKYFLYLSIINSVYIIIFLYYVWEPISAIIAFTVFLSAILFIGLKDLT